MKWTKRNEQGAGCLGQGYQSGEYIVEETSYRKTYELQEHHGGRVKDYYWTLRKGETIIKYGSTAKSLKQYVEEKAEA